MTKLSSGDALSRVIEQLQPFEESERERVIRAVLSFFGVARDAGRGDSEGRREDLPYGDGSRKKSRQAPAGAKAYFDEKQPHSKIEELAVAARFREETENADSSSQEELGAIFRAARRTFDAHNFKRDVDNARNKGLFMRGTGRDSLHLSSYGQTLVDTLPDRDSAKALKPKVKRRGGRKKSAKKSKA
jgi:hypothetical protein